MSAAEPSPNLSFDELARIVDENCEPFLTIEQTLRYIKAASMYRRREPDEVELSGDRAKKRDIEAGLIEARKALAIFQVSSLRTTVISPTDCLR